VLHARCYILAATAFSGSLPRSCSSAPDALAPPLLTLSLLCSRSYTLPATLVLLGSRCSAVAALRSAFSPLCARCYALDEILNFLTPVVFCAAGCFAHFPGVFCASGVFYTNFPECSSHGSVLCAFLTNLAGVVRSEFPVCFAMSTAVLRTSGGREPRLVLGCYQSTGSVQNRGVQTPAPDAFHSWCRVQRSSVQVCSMVFPGVDYNRLKGGINVHCTCETHLDPVLITSGAIRMDRASYTPGEDAVSRVFLTSARVS
jgi:hypothetical protein